MIRFSPSEAALEGFRITRAHPAAVLAWAVLRLVYGVFSLVVMVQSGWVATMTQINLLSHAQPRPDAEKLASLLAQLMPAMLTMAAVGLVFYAVAYTAVLRAVLRPADKRFFYLRLSVDELRQFGLALFIFALFFLYACAVNLVSFALISVAKGLGGAALPVQILVVLAVIAAFVYPVIRLSMAPALTFTSGRITLFRAWPLTRGQFWQVFGTFLLAVVLGIVVSLLATVIFVFVVGAVGAAQHGLSDITAVFGVMQPDEVSLSWLTQPVGLAKLIFGALLNTLAYLILFAPAAAIFRELKGGATAPVAAPTSVQPGKPWG
jgi:hypothetical protein